MPASNFLKRLKLNTFVRNLPPTLPTAVYVALYNTDPTADDTGVELAGGGYERAPASFGDPVLQGNVAWCSNPQTVQFPRMTESRDNANFFGIKTAKAGGNLLYYDSLKTSQEMKEGYEPFFDVGELKLGEE